MSDTVTLNKGTIRATVVALSILAVGTWIEVQAAEAISGPSSIEVVQEMQNGAKSQEIQFAYEFDFSFKEKYDFDAVDWAAIQREPINRTAFEDKLTKLNIALYRYRHSSNSSDEYKRVKHEIEGINLQRHDALSTYILNRAEYRELTEQCKGDISCFEANKQKFVNIVNSLESIQHLDSGSKVNSTINSLQNAYYNTLTKNEKYKQAALNKFKQN
ncbi:hypothetical protein CTH30272_03080 [Allocatenococcus thiocycli]|nr:hypothetical protein CTH30272_03080 [Catenococcus thiocycli]